VTVQPADIRTIPLFANIPDERLTDLIGVFDTKTVPAGHVLFRSGEVPTSFILLSRGEVTLEEAGDAKFRLRPCAPIGELGALTGLPRNATAIAATEAEIMTVGVPKLLAFLEKHADTGFAFYKNLLGVVSTKVRKDDRRTEEMRANLIRTQKAMKSLREIVLSSAETEISKPVCEALDDLIEHNRRSHYRVSPAPTFPAHVRIEDATPVRVVDLSDGYIKLDTPPSKLSRDASSWVGVLVMPLGEILLSGTVEREGADGVVVKLDVMIDAYKAMLEDYVTRLQLLDYVV
jgi:CRP/FNR family cyclic AMP-dependent transcriptional regulator